MPFHVVLYEPEIPPNTGNIIRIAANTGATLHLIEPLGFAWDDTRLKRAGLDYHEYADVNLHASLEAFLGNVAPERVWAFTTRASRPFAEADFHTGDALLSGPETRGLPTHVLDELPAQRRLRIPMCADSRILNLANAVAVAVYEGWRQLGFDGGR